MAKKSNKFESIPSKLFPSYYEIPGYSRYVINERGELLSKIYRRQLHGRVDEGGYMKYSVSDDRNHRHDVGRYRLMALAFIDPEGRNVKKLHVNHKNSIRLDDRLENLEWVTPSENVKHSYRDGYDRMERSKRHSSISVRFIDTGEVRKYNSVKEASDDLGMYIGTLYRRALEPEIRVWPERRQYRFGTDDREWEVPEDIEREIRRYGCEKVVLKRDVITGEVEEYGSQQKLCEATGLSPSAISVALTKTNQPVHVGFFQLKYKDDDMPWREPGDLYIEIEDSDRRYRVIKVTEYVTGRSTIFFRAATCAHAMGIKTNTLNERLKYNDPEKVWSDGFSYVYYRDYPYSKEEHDKIFNIKRSATGVTH